MADLHKLTIGAEVELDGRPLNVTDEPVTLELVDKGLMIARLSVFVSSSDLDADDDLVQVDRPVILKYSRRP